MASMEYSTMSEIARNGSEDDFVNLLRIAGKYVKIGTEERWLDSIYEEMAKDPDKIRKARKLSIITAYDAEGDKALKNIPAYASSTELETLRQLAFKSASEKVVELLKAQANDEEAVRYIIQGAQMDHKRRFRWEKKEDKRRRSDKKDIIAEFYAKSGRFAPAETDTPDALAAQTRIAELENRVAEMETAAAKQQPKKPTVLKLQQPS